MNNDMIRRQLGHGAELNIDGEKIYLKPLGIEYFGDFLEMGKAMVVMEGKDTSELTNAEAIKLFTPDIITIITRLIKDTLKKSMPDVEEELRAEWGMKYFGDVLNGIMTVNSFGSSNHGDVKKQQMLEKLRAKRDDESTKKD